jgi:membrane protein YdbS with pleckstrin-like domain
MEKKVANKSSRDISLTSWLVWLLCSAIAIFYAVIQYQVTGKGTALIFSSVRALLFVSITACLIVLYRKGGRSKLDRTE